MVFLGYKINREATYNIDRDPDTDEKTIIISKEFEEEWEVTLMTGSWNIK